MANETTITVIGRLTGDPELRFTPSGAAVANFTVASNARRFNKDTNEWVDEPAVFWPCSVWRAYAENVAESLTKGDHVIVVGTVKRREWEDKDGGKRERIELDVVEVGPALRWASAPVQRAARGGASASDPWGSGPQTTDEPPF